MLDLSPYLFIARTRVLVALAYRFEVLASFCGAFVIMVTSLYVWKAAYQNVHSIAGVNMQEMLVYAALSVSLSGFFHVQIANKVNARIRNGDISLDCMRPIYLPGLWLAEEVGTSVVTLFIQGIPLLVGAWIFIGFPGPHNGAAFLFFLPALVFSYMIIWLSSATVSLIAFWAQELGNFSLVHNTILLFLSGSVVPVWFFPSSFQNILQWLPFMYTYQGTIGIYIGKYQAEEAARILIIQIFWALILGFIFRALWKKARRKVLIQGG